MSDKISVDPDRLEQAAYRLGVEAENIRLIIATLRRRLNILEEHWEGKADLKFLCQYDQAEAMLLQAPELLDIAKASMKAVASRFRAIDSL